ncbi:MAG: glycosyltransferase family 2 protein [Proteobacteria bacterium]|nr:glycosyltransferase family 2 protein [Pseudomonadota bacterium]
MGEKTPMVSVIIPTFNRSHTILRSIGSVLSQSYQNFELIIVDDASTDDTEFVVSGIVDDRIKYIRHETNKGGSAARNTGISHSKGKYVAFQDSDDEWFYNKLEMQMAVFESMPQILAVYSGYLLEKDGELKYMPTEQLYAGSGQIFTKLLRGNCVSTQTLIVNNDILKKIGGFDERLPRLQDWELVLRLSKEVEFQFLDQPLVKVYYTPDSITANPYKLIIATEYILNKYAQDFNNHSAIKANQLYMLGLKYFEFGPKNCAIKTFINSLTCEIQPRSVLAILCSLFGYSFFDRLRNILKKNINSNL